MISFKQWLDTQDQTSLPVLRTSFFKSMWTPTHERLVALYCAAALREHVSYQDHEIERLKEEVKLLEAEREETEQHFKDLLG